MSEQKSLFSIRIKKLRESKNLKQQDLAKILNISNSAISKWEQGAREPDFKTLKVIADYFNVSTDYLIGKDTNNSIPDYFETPQKAIKFILEQPMIANFGGYDLELMSDQEIMDMAEDVADMLRIMTKKHKK
jgi:transcriptional regulator with XRE-family HTH domain